LLVVLGWVQIFPLVVGWVGLGQSADGLGWIGSDKIDPWTTLRCANGVTTLWRYTNLRPDKQNILRFIVRLP